MTKFTQGPWKWRINQQSKYILLKGGDKIVMDFVRYGMNGAMPRFRSERGLMIKSNTLAVNIPGEEHHSRWNQDIDHPDARLIASAPDLYSALEEAISWLTETDKGRSIEQINGQPGEWMRKAQDAIKKARGKS